MAPRAGEGALGCRSRHALPCVPQEVASLGGRGLQGARS